LIEIGPPRNGQLPSICPECLQIQTYMRFAHIDFELDESGSDRLGNLPVLVDEKGDIKSGRRSIIEFLKESGFRLDVDDMKDFDAYVTFAEEKLKVIYSYLWWHVSSNYSYSSEAFSSSVPFPKNILYPRKMWNRHQLEVFELLDDEKFLNLVQSCLYTLSIKLGKNTFFYGESPTTLDCVVFSYLMLIFVPDFSFPEKLRSTTYKYKNLINYCNRIMQIYFTEYPFLPITIKKPKEIVEESTKKDIETKKEQKLSKLSAKSIGIALLLFAIYGSLYNDQVIQFLHSPEQNTE